MKGLVLLVPAVVVPSVWSLSVWHFTDVHLDPQYVNGAALKGGCHGNVTNSTGGAGPFGAPSGDCATPLALYESALAFAAASAPADAVFFTGDFTVAGLTTSEEVKSTIKEVWRLLRAALPGVKVFGTLGNHDNAPNDDFPYPCDIYEAISPYVGEDLDHFGRQTFRDGGHYLAKVSDGYYVVSLNTNYLTTLNPRVTNGSDAWWQGAEQLNFLQLALEDAEETGDKIAILGHIPLTGWDPTFVRRYQGLVADHRSVVVGQFYGHRHEDYVRLTRECDGDGPCVGAATGVVYVGPSLTEGYPAENPGFRRYDLDDDGRAVRRAHTYSADLAAANSQGNIDWHHEYEAADAYGMPSLDPSDWERALRDMLDDGERFERFFDRRRRAYRGPSAPSTPFIETVCTVASASRLCVASLVCNMLFLDAPPLESTWTAPGADETHSNCSGFPLPWV